MNILITGGLGHLGTFFLKNIHIINGIKKIYVVDKLSDRFLNLINLKINTKVYFLNLDLSKNKIILNNVKINYVIHLASITNIQESLIHKRDIYKNNLNCFYNVINFCKRKEAKLIHISSTSIYGSQEKIVNESCKELVANNPYSKIKIIEEKYLKKNKKKIKFVTLRFGTIVGLSSGMRFHTAVNKFCMDAFLNKPLGVWKTAYNQYRPYLSIRDAFHAIIFIIKNDIFNKEKYNVISDNLRVKDIIKRINKFKKTKYTLINNLVMNNFSYKVDNKKIKKIGFKNKKNITVDIKNIFNSLKFKKNAKIGN